MKSFHLLIFCCLLSCCSTLFIFCALWMRMFVSANAAWIFYAYRCILFASSIVPPSVCECFYYFRFVSNFMWVMMEKYDFIVCSPVLIVRRVSTLALCCAVCYYYGIREANKIHTIRAQIHTIPDQIYTQRDRAEYTQWWYWVLAVDCTSEPL